VEDLHKDFATLVEQIPTRYLDGTPVPAEELVYIKALKGERTVREVLVRHPTTGEDIALRSSAAPVRQGDRVVGAVAVNIDITARLAEADELRAALDFRDRILGVLSHDVRNPLGVVLASAGLLERQLSAAGNEKQLTVVKRMIANARAIERMVRDLVDYTRTRHGRGLPIFAVETDLLQLCQQVIDGMQVLHPDRPLQVSAEGNTVSTVDPDRATQVITNLVGNALLYSPAGSPVRVVLRGLEDAVLLEVNNQGPPIPAETLPRIFEAFHGGAADGGGSTAGLGLGLYIASQIAEAHGGSISVRSDSEEGTTFTVRWPRGGR
jgi:signal transduction histidine kinase